MTLLLESMETSQFISFAYRLSTAPDLSSGSVEPRSIYMCLLPLYQSEGIFLRLLKIDYNLCLTLRVLKSVNCGHQTAL